MTIDEYLGAKKALNLKHNTDLRKLAIDYALSNNPHKIGDVISDHMHTIRIEKVQASYTSESVPCCVYTGPQLRKKDLQPMVDRRKNPITESIWQPNITK